LGLRAIRVEETLEAPHAVGMRSRILLERVYDLLGHSLCGPRPRCSLKLREERQDKCGALPEQVLALTRTGACAGDDDAVSDWIRTESRRSSWSRWVIIEPRFSPAQSSEPTDERLPAGRGVGEGQLATWPPVLVTNPVRAAETGALVSTYGRSRLAAQP